MNETIRNSQTVNENVDRHLFAPGPKRILSLDGGGVRGAISVAFLERIEQIFAEKAYADYLEGEGRTASAQEREARRKEFADTVRLADHFDIVGGTSTGALIAGALALGFRTSQIKEFYLERANKVFRRPVWRIPGLQAKFDARALQREIDHVVEERTLDSNDLITGLCVVTKRMDTGSPWIITNNPRAPYWETKLPNPATGENGHIGNRYYKLSALVRASTAAPHFFDPEIVQIVDKKDKKHLPPDAPAKSETGAAAEAEKVEGVLSWVNDQLNRWPRATMWLTKLRARVLARGQGPSPDTHGLFVDGGVTPFNNPSLAILMQVALKPYRICWPLGPDELTFVSIGTGSYRTRLTFSGLGFAGPLKLALHSLLSMMGDSQQQALAQMQWLGECPDPWPINSEVGTLAGELPPGRRWFRFMRYDVRLETDWIEKNLGRELQDYVTERFRNMDNPDIIMDIYELAKKAAAMQVKPEHFFPARSTTAATPAATQTV